MAEAETAHEAHVDAEHGHAPHGGHHAPTGFIRKYIFSIDHKVIGIQYILLALFSVFVGLIMSVLMRMKMTWPEYEWPFLETLFGEGAPGGMISQELYLSLVTMHGTIMVFFVLTTAPQGGFGNYFMPIQVGADDMAFPVLNMLSFWVTFLGLAVLVAAIFASGGSVIGPTGGWTGYAPLSAVGHLFNVPGQGTGITLWVVSIAIFCVASLLGALNFIVTLLNLRTKGMSLMRMPLTCWAWFTTAVLALLSFPVLLAAGVLLLLDHTAGTSFFVPGGLSNGTTVIDHSGGSPILWQHLFWFFGHPEVYIAILPGMGATSHILSTFARKPIFGYRAMVFAMFAIGLLGFFVWGHHMFLSGMSPLTGAAFSVLTLSIGVPSAIKTFNWLGTLWGARIRFHTPMLFAIGFVSLFVAGGITGLVLGQTSLDLSMHDTYFVLAHFHLVMGVAAIFGMFAGTYFWFPKMFGRKMNETLGKIHFWPTMIGVYAIFIPMHVMGLVGLPRRYSQFYEVIDGRLEWIYHFNKPTHGLIHFVTWAAIITVAAQFLFIFNFFWSLWKGEKASDNPWEATTLEWITATPPPHDNFGGRVPTVYRGAYEFGVPGAPEDFVLQTTPDETGPNVAYADDVTEQGQGGSKGQGSNGHDVHG